MEFHGDHSDAEASRWHSCPFRNHKTFIYNGFCHSLDCSTSILRVTIWSGSARFNFPEARRACLVMSYFFFKSIPQSFKLVLHFLSIVIWSVWFDWVSPSGEISHPRGVVNGFVGKITEGTEIGALLSVLVHAAQCMSPHDSSLASVIMTNFGV